MNVELAVGRVPEHFCRPWVKYVKIESGKPEHVLEDIHYELGLNYEIETLRLQTTDEIVAMECLSWGLDHPGCLSLYVEGQPCPLDGACRPISPALEQYFSLISERRRALIKKRYDKATRPSEPS
jgi:hypothetical protein